MSKKTAAHVALFLCALLCAACSGEEEDGYVFPSLVTEFVELHTDDTGLGTQFTTDGGSGFAVNAPLQGLQPNALYRLVLGYETTDETRGGLPVARVYTVDYVALLQPTEEPAAEDEPTGIDAVWRGADYLNLQLGQPTEAVMIPRGSFYQLTGGSWIYVVNAEGTKAFRRKIRIGRQNPQYYEVLEGLDPGEKVITSSYDNFGEHDVLMLK